MHYFAFTVLIRVLKVGGTGVLLDCYYPSFLQQIVLMNFWEAAGKVAIIGGIIKVGYTYLNPIEVSAPSVQKIVWPYKGDASKASVVFSMSIKNKLPLSIGIKRVFGWLYYGEVKLTKFETLGFTISAFRTAIVQGHVELDLSDLLKAGIQIFQTQQFIGKLSLRGSIVTNDFTIPLNTNIALV